MTEALNNTSSHVRDEHASASRTQKKSATAQGRATLPDDVADLILRHLVAQSLTLTHQNPHYYSGKSTLLAFALVSRAFYLRTLPFLYADTSFNVTRSERFVKFQRFCGSIILNRKLGRYVETLELINDNPGVFELHIPMFNAFRRLEGLKKLTFVVQRAPIQQDEGEDDGTDVDENGCLGQRSKGKGPQPKSISWVHDIALSVRTNLTVLLTLPTLTHLTLSGIGMLPFALLTSLTKIEELCLGPNLDIDTSDETGMFSRTPMVKPEDVNLQSLELRGVSPNLIKNLSSILACKPGVVRRLSLSSVDAGVDVCKEIEAQSRRSESEGLDDWVVTDVEDDSPDEDATITVKNLAKRKFGFGASGKSKSLGKKQSSTASFQQPHSPFAKGVWLLIEVAGTSLEKFEWEASATSNSSFKPINLHFLRHTLRFLTISIWYHRAITSNEDSILGDVSELCKQLASPDAVLEQLTIRCLCYDPPSTSPLSVSCASSSSKAKGTSNAQRSTPIKSKTLPSRLPSHTRTPSKPSLQRMESASSAESASHSASSSTSSCATRDSTSTPATSPSQSPRRGLKTTPAAAQPYPSPAPPSSLPQSPQASTPASGIKNIDYYKEWINLDAFLTSKISVEAPKTPPRAGPKPKPSFDKLSASLSLGDTFSQKSKRSFKSLKGLRVEFVAERDEAQKEVEELDRHAKSVEKWMGKVKARGISVSGVAVRL